MPNAGTIYAIGAEGTSLVKIGSTSGTVEKRLKALQTGQPFPLCLIASIPVDEDLRAIEHRVHRFLQEARRRGEWFEGPMDAAQLEALVVRAVAYVEEAEECSGADVDHHLPLPEGRGLPLSA